MEIGVAICVIMGVSPKLLAAPAAITCCSMPGGSESEASARATFPGAKLFAGRVLSKSLTSSISRIGVMPQIASGDVLKLDKIRAVRIA